jgi:Ca-activated chloride channel family protein
MGILLAMLKKLAALAYIALVVCVPAALAQDGDGDETIRVATELVSVPVVVTDKKGHYVADIKQTEFEVFQDGVRQDLEFFAAVEEPVTVALLIDTSHSTRPVLDDIKDAARSFIKLLKPQDRGLIVAFDYDTHVLSELTGDQEKLRKAIKSAEIPDPIGTKLRDAIHDTVFDSFKGIVGRKALIVLTDGRDGGSHINANALLTRLQQTDTLVYPVQFRTEERRRIEQMLRTGRLPSGPRRLGGDSEKAQQRRERNEELEARARDFLMRLALSTAGRYYESQTGDLKKTFASIVDELRRQYRLGYYPPDETATDAVHTIGVRVARPDLIVRSRLRYQRKSTEK